MNDNHDNHLAWGVNALGEIVAAVAVIALPFVLLFIGAALGYA